MIFRLQLPNSLANPTFSQRLQGRLGVAILHWSGIGNEAVSRIERGIGIPNIARLLGGAGIFCCEAAELLTEANSRPDDQACRIIRLLMLLDHDDRQLIVGLVERVGQFSVGRTAFTGSVFGQRQQEEARAEIVRLEVQREKAQEKPFLLARPPD